MRCGRRIIRYTAATTTDTAGDVVGPLRGRAHAIASAFAVYTGRNRLATTTSATP